MKKILNNDFLKSKMHLPCFYPKNYTIAFEGDQCDKIGIIAEGKVQLIHYTHDGDEIILGELKQYDVFGDFLIHAKDSVYPGNLTAIEETEIIYINKEQLDDFLATSSEFRSEYLSNLCRKASEMNTINKILHQSSLEKKIVLWLENALLTAKSDKVKIESKESLAKRLNVRRPSLSRTLGKMKKEGILDYNRAYIWIKPTCEFKQQKK